MGGTSSSVSKTDIYTQNIVESLSRAIQNCEGNTVISQRVVIKGNYNVVKNVRMVQGMKLSTSCIVDDKNISSIQQAVENAIKQQSSAQNSAVLGALTNSAARSEASIRNEVRATITRETIQNIVNNFNSVQEFFLDGNSNIVEDITMEQSMDVLNQQSLAALSQMAVVQDIRNVAAQETTATQTNPISEIIGAVGDIVKSLGAMGMIVVIIAMIVGAYFLLNGGDLSMFFVPDPNEGDDVGSGQQQEQQQY